MSDITDQSSPRVIDPAELRRKYREERDKRIRPDGRMQYIDVSGTYEGFASDPYLAQSPGGQPREPRTVDVDTVVLGGGWAGLQMAVRLDEAGADDFLIIDEAGDFGGVWYWNRYPGVRCDIESYIYMPLLEEVGTIPSEKYAGGPEMLEHARALGRHYDLYSRALLGTKVTRVEWNESRSRWAVRTNRGDVIDARFLVIGTGPLNRPKLPGIPGIETFQGQAFHSSRWDYDITGGDWSGNLDKLAGKRVALIGTGATSIQILPPVAESAEHVYVFQRTPGAVFPRNNRPTDPEWFRGLEPGWQRKRMDNFVEVMAGLPVENLVNDVGTNNRQRFAKAMSGPGGPNPAAMQAMDFEVMEEARQWVRDNVEDAATAAALMPWYDYLCKRPLYSDDYYPTFNRGNVTLIDTDGKGVERITERGVVVAGAEFDVDVIIYSTGFQAQAYTYDAGGYELRGRDGVSLADHWRNGMHSLHGMMTTAFPNLFLIGGVEQAAISINLPHVASRQAVHIAALVSRFVGDGVVVAEATPDAEQRWADELARVHVDMSRYEAECTPSYWNNEGKADDIRPTTQGGQYGRGPIGYLAVLEQWRAAEVDRDLTLRTAVEASLALAETRAP
ncbi:flavin-containing monooxygenase [Microbacterium sp. RD1]|uniref:flavin-containing monooxygenase n=1 Tax=Microbacterium sp. RD1 TaxID=3457313 RepID=UPI003FA582C6